MDSKKRNAPGLVINLSNKGQEKERNNSSISKQNTLKNFYLASGQIRTVQDTEPRTNGERKLCCVVIGQLGAGWRLIFVLTYGWRLYQILKSHLAQLWAVCRPLKDAVRLGHSCRRLCAASDSVIHEDGIFISTTTFAMEELHPKEEIPGKKYLTTRLQFIWLQERF